MTYLDKFGSLTPQDKEFILGNTVEVLRREFRAAQQRNDYEYATAIAHEILERAGIPVGGGQ